jgi:hypothetical protein
MLDVSRYTGERTRRGLQLVKFWGKGSGDALRKTNSYLSGKTAYLMRLGQSYSQGDSSLRSKR